MVGFMNSLASADAYPFRPADRCYCLPDPLHTVQLPEPLHFSQSYGGRIDPFDPLPWHFEHLPVPSQPLHSAILIHLLPVHNWWIQNSEASAVRRDKNLYIGKVEKDNN